MSKETGLEQTFEFSKEAGFGCLYKKVVVVKKGGLTRYFFVGLERFWTKQHGKEFNNRSYALGRR